MIFYKAEKVLVRDDVRSLAQGFRARVLVVIAMALTLSLSARAQSVQTPGAQLGKVMGTVTDMNGDAVIGAAVTLSGGSNDQQHPAVTDQNGFFELSDVKPRVSYQVVISATGFAPWTSPAMTLDPGQFKLLGGIQLQLATQHTTVHVTYDKVEIATEQLKTEETQRLFGVVPNFYINYDPDAAPLTTKLKFQLALRVSVDPVTIAGVTLVSASKQAANTPDYGQGWGAYGERFGATAADGFIDIMVGGAILPSLLHEDPRYFYQGSGTTKSRLRHAMLSPFISKRDNGSWGPNYSSLGGDLASSAIADLYYPRSNRGPGLVFGQFAIGTAERIGASVAQEFLLSRVTHRAGHIQ